MLRVCCCLSGSLLCFMAVISPWALGSIPRWAVWMMNGGGYLLGLLLLLTWIGRARTGRPVPRWNSGEPAWVARLLAALMGVILLWTLTSAVNAKSSFVAAEVRLQDYASYVEWLPHSYDGPGTWFAFWTYLGLICVFWAGRDWLTAVPNDEFERWQSRQTRSYLPRRLRTLLWALSINGCLLGVVSTFQRLDGTSSLLWLFPGTTSEAQFGPFDYRGNAAQYFNLLWPLTLALWWGLGSATVRRTPRVERIGTSPRIVLPVAVAVMAACPIVASTRGGAVISVAMLLGAGLLLLPHREGVPVWRRLVPLGVAVTAAGFGLYLGWARLGPRILQPDIASRLELAQPLEDFELQLRIAVPGQGPRHWTGLVGLSDLHSLGFNRPDAFCVWITGDGALAVTQFGAVTTNFVQRVLPAFLDSHAGKEVEVTIRRDTEVSVLVDGGRATTQERRYGLGAAWRGPLSPRYLVLDYYRRDGGEPSCHLRSVSLSRREAADVDNPDGRAVLAAVQVAAEPIRRVWAFRREGWSGRSELYTAASIMAGGLPALLGSGPGSFAGLFRVHAAANRDTYWPHAHNDWLETRITFGLLGSLPVLALVMGVTLRPLIRGGLRVRREVVWLLWLGLAGSAVHAIFDYPFQVHSVVFLCLLLFLILSQIQFRASASLR